jgi:hypothetical protein
LAADPLTLAKSKSPEWAYSIIVPSNVGNG